MTSPPPIAFYAPLKSPLHPDPSGDRTMARLMMKALARASFEPQLASELRTFERQGSAEEQQRIRRESEAAARDLVARYRARPADGRPRLWFTYHVYYKAPDWIGPLVADGLGIPYVVAEGSRAGKRASGPWALGHRGAEAALDRARVVFAMTRHDRAGLDRARPAGQDIVDLPPFLDMDAWGPPARSQAERDAPKLLTVAMMREGDKLASYALLAEALAAIRRLPWTLDIVGNGPAEKAVRRLFAPLGERVRFRGRADDPARLAALYGGADLFLWPAVNEAYGMALLEAQACGCPVVAGNFGGVSSVVRDGESGLLTPPGDAAAFAGTVARIVGDRDLRARLGETARRFVAEDRSLDATAARFRRALLPLLAVTA